MRKSVFALAHVFLLLIWVHPLFASEPASYSTNDPDSQTVFATRQGVRTFEKGCPVEEAAILDLSKTKVWRQASLSGIAYASARLDTATQDPPEENMVPLATGVWFMGAGLVVFVISRKRFRG